MFFRVMGNEYDTILILSWPKVDSYKWSSSMLIGGALNTAYISNDTII